MRLLLTRPTQDAARTRAKLEALGHHVFVAPVIEIVPTNAQWPGGLVDGILATSANAFDALADATGPSREARRLMPLLLVGGRTEEAARRRGFAGEAIVGANAADLETAIERSGHPSRRPSRRIVYLAGHDRKANAEAALIAKGQIVDVVETYEARVTEIMPNAAAMALRAGHLEGVLHFSRRSAALFLFLMTKERLQAETLDHFCLSEDVATLLREAGCPRTHEAEAPNETALLDLLPNETSD